MAVKIPLKKKKELQEQAVKNTTITKGTKGNQKTIKEGTPLDHTPQHNINKTSPRTVGINIGATINMGDFNSYRVDCWLTDELLDNETQEEGLQRLASICKDEVERLIQEEQE